MSPGSYGIVTNGVSEAQVCATCDAGFYCPSNSTVSLTRVVCPAGGYCVEGSSAITYCSAGYKSALTGQSSVATCEICERGMYCLHAGVEDGVLCPAGYYCPEGTEDYHNTPCPAGTYGEDVGYYSASQCTVCPIGHYCTGAASITPCLPGTYNSEKSGNFSGSCIPCEAGYACPVAAMVEMTTPCASGHYCWTGTVKPSQNAWPASEYTHSIS